MSKAKFSFEGTETVIQCLKDEKMKNICNKYSTKINIDINSLIFLYGGNQVNQELAFNEQTNSVDKERNEINILVYKNKQREENKLKCPKCGEIIQFN